MTKNYFVNFEDGSSMLVYTEELSEQEVQQWAEITHGKVIEVYHIPQEELQYYCIDERVWAYEPDTIAAMREVISKAKKKINH